jgi:hypothetical protein
MARHHLLMLVKIGTYTPTRLRSIKSRTNVNTSTDTTNNERAQHEHSGTHIPPSLLADCWCAGQTRGMCIKGVLGCNGFGIEWWGGVGVITGTTVTTAPYLCSPRRAIALIIKVDEARAQAPQAKIASKKPVQNMHSHNHNQQHTSRKHNKLASNRTLL